MTANLEHAISLSLLLFRTLHYHHGILVVQSRFAETLTLTPLTPISANREDTILVCVFMVPVVSYGLWRLV